MLQVLVITLWQSRRPWRAEKFPPRHSLHPLLTWRVLSPSWEKVLQFSLGRHILQRPAVWERVERGLQGPQGHCRCCPLDGLWQGSNFQIFNSPAEEMLQSIFFYMNKQTKIRYRMCMLMLSLYQYLCVATIILTYFKPFPFQIVHY